MSSHSAYSWVAAEGLLPPIRAGSAPVANVGGRPVLSAAISAIARSSSIAAAFSCSCTLVVSAVVIVASSSTSTWPACTLSPSFTSTRLTTLFSSGCSVLVRSLTTMRPGATATMSIWPMQAHVMAATKSAQIRNAARRGAG